MRQKTNLLSFWAPIIGLHALHQVEEGMGYFKWMLDRMDQLPKWATFNHVAFKIGAEKPAYFFLASLAQITATSLVAVAVRNKPRTTKILMLFYLTAMAVIFIWHIAGSIAAQSPAPVMITCLGGLYIIPFIAVRVLRCNLTH